jgi:hypothetical protein
VKLGAQLAAHAGQAPVVSELLLDTTTRLGRAGWEVMWQGWFRLQERVDTYLATRDFLDFPRHVHLPRGVEEDRLGVSRDDTH